MAETVSSVGAGQRPFALRLTLDSPLGLTPELRRFAAGLALSSFYGLALGARSGGAALVWHGLGVPFGLAVLSLVMAPSLTVLFAILDAPITPARVLASLGRALSSVGLVLAGLAPGAALIVVSVESRQLATLIADLGFYLSGGIGLVQLGASFRGAIAGAPWRVRWKARALFFGYAVFAVMLAVRVFSLCLPMLGGGS